MIEGVFENIDDKGNLILKVGSKKEIIDNGENNGKAPKSIIN